MTMRPGSTVPVSVWKVDHSVAQRRRDWLATEEPLEIRLLAAAERESLAVTMRTPGNDFELAAGFLFSEGVIAHRQDIEAISYCTDPDEDPEQLYNIVNVRLRAGQLPDLAHLDRHFYTASACGICGKATLDALRLRSQPSIDAGPQVESTMLEALPGKLRQAQGIFEKTGGLHAAALFTPEGALVAHREDIGRHNALDKLIGWALLEARLPLREGIVLVSGRASYEILQKCAVAGVPVVCAISAPSSLAVQAASEFGITLVGFLRGRRFNIYSGKQRLSLMASEADPQTA